MKFLGFQYAGKYCISVILLCTNYVIFSFQATAQDTKFQKFKLLSCPEKVWVMTHPFIAGKTLKISEKARKVAKAMVNDTLLDAYENGGKADAFRHAYWMASLVRDIRWRKAYKLGKAHEKGNKKDFKKKREEEGGILPDSISCEMDLWNNKAGLEIGRKYFYKQRKAQTNKIVTDEELIQAVKQAITGGKCKMIKMNKNGDFLDNSGAIIPDVEWQGKWVNKRCLVNSDFSGP